jgi:hypothetical protein
MIYDLIQCCGVKKMSMMKMILTSDNVIIEERQIVQLKEEIESLTNELTYREKKLQKLRSTKKK